MPSAEILSQERLRSVEQAATETANASLTVAPPFSDSKHSAEETLRLLQQKLDRPGVRVDALSATVKSGETAIRSEVTMSGAAAEELFGLDPARQKRRQAEHLQLWRATNQSQLQDVTAQAYQKALPDCIQPILDRDQHEQSDEALDELFDCIDPILSSADFEKVDGILAAFPVEGPSLSLMMGLLSITRPAAEHLPSRQRFFERVLKLCKAMRRDAESLLGGLR